MGKWRIEWELGEHGRRIIMGEWLAREIAVRLRPGGASPAPTTEKTPAGCRRYQTELRISWIWSSHWACSGFIRTERRVVMVGLSRCVEARRFWKKATGSSARARWRFLVAAESKILRDAAEISVRDVVWLLGRGTKITMSSSGSKAGMNL